MKPKKNTNSGVEILIAEDSPTQAEQLRYLLEEHGFAVTAAPDGKQALAAARRRKPTLVISDVMMPEMDGFALCREIKRDERLKDIPVILLTSLSDVRDIMQGLECGADNFIRKPYEERYLLARVDYLLMNLELRKSQKMRMGVEIYLGGRKHFISAEQQQIVDLLISIYEEAIHINEELKERQRELAYSNRSLSGLYHVAEGLNRAVGEREVCEKALEHAMELPGVQAGWISLWEQENNAFRTAAVRNLPPALLREGAMEGECECRRRFLAGELDRVTNILECERLKGASGDTQGLRYHASVPLWIGDRSLGILSLVGAEQGLFQDGELETLYGVGHQVGIALERARLHERLEQLVEQRTAALTAEIAERKKVEAAQARLVAILDATSDLVGITDSRERIIYLNAGGRGMLGIGPEEDLSISTIADYCSAEQRDLVLTKAIPAAVRDGAWSGETQVRSRDGHDIPVSQVILAHKDESGNLRYLSTIARDITLSKKQEARIMRLNRVYHVLSGINGTIVRVRDRQQLFEDACRIVVEHGKFIFAWIGTLDAGTQQVTPVARAGHEDGYLSRINLSAREDAPGSCVLIARALTQAAPVVCNDIASDERTEGLRSETLARGYRSVAVFPFIVESQPVGVGVIYASEPGVFDEEEMRLLTELAGDIAFALDHLEKEQRLNYLAYFDAITGLPNQALFLERLDRHLAGARSDRKTFSVIMLDLDRFGAINETLGRQAGDELLRQFARRLEQALEESDVAARLAANRFGIVRRSVDDSTEVAHLLERILLDIEALPFRVNGNELRISVRAGIALFPADGADADGLYRNAEAALKKAKLSGDKYLFYTAELNARVAENLALENKLHRALEQRQLALHYQPKIDLGTGRISGLEALMRWNDPEAGPVPPVRFISILEETGLILEAGRWAMEQAIEDWGKWRASGLRPPRVAVNVSAIQLRQKDFVATVERMLSGAEDTSGALELEITESLIMQDIEANIARLKAVRDMGVGVVIDDFGTGYSSLSYIARLPINALKIDRAFIVNMTGKPDDLSIVSTIISLAHSLNLKVVAEGVETEEQAKLLRLLKCDEMQGYLFSPAVPAEQIERFLREKKSLPG